jgi:hypothetical protein
VLKNNIFKPHFSDEETRDMRWIIEDFAPDNNFGKLAEAARAAGHKVDVISYEPFQSKDLSDIRVEAGEKVLFQGSIQFAQQIQNTKPHWVPGVFASWKNFECTSYYVRYGEHLFNSNYIMMPLQELFRRWRDLMNTFDGDLFVRPNTSMKTFSGVVLGEYEFSDSRIKHTRDLLTFDASPTDLIVVSGCRQPVAEWRVICSSRGVVTGCQYRTVGIPNVQAGIPDEVRLYAQSLCNGPTHPDPMYVLDICYHRQTSYRLLEAGPFSVAGLYACDVDKIVAEASALIS